MEVQRGQSQSAPQAVIGAIKASFKLPTRAAHQLGVHALASVALALLLATPLHWRLHAVLPHMPLAVHHPAVRSHLRITATVGIRTSPHWWLHAVLLHVRPAVQRPPVHSHLRPLLALIMLASASYGLHAVQPHVGGAVHASSPCAVLPYLVAPMLLAQLACRWRHLPHQKMQVLSSIIPIHGPVAPHTPAEWLGRQSKTTGE
jgi:hypothetical protein